MEMRRLLSMLLVATLLALLLGASLTVPAFAAVSGTSRITWSSAGRGQNYYNGELCWLALVDSDTWSKYIIDVDKETRVEYDDASNFISGLAQVAIKGAYYMKSPTMQYLPVSYRLHLVICALKC